jgi:hypothetical protein
MFENWSLPWHTLQRSLAQAFDREAELCSQVKAKPPNFQRTGSPSNNWLVRARSCRTALTLRQI